MHGNCPKYFLNLFTMGSKKFYFVWLPICMAWETETGLRQERNRERQIKKIEYDTCTQLSWPHDVAVYFFVLWRQKKNTRDRVVTPLIELREAFFQDSVGKSLSSWVLWGIDRSVPISFQYAKNFEFLEFIPSSLLLSLYLSLSLSAPCPFVSFRRESFASSVAAATATRGRNSSRQSGK